MVCWPGALGSQRLATLPTKIPTAAGRAAALASVSRRPCISTHSMLTHLRLPRPLGELQKMVFEKRVLIDGRGHLLGRLASTIAKELISGQKVTVVRCESINISGNFYRNKRECCLIRVPRLQWWTARGGLRHVQITGPPEVVA